MEEKFEYTYSAPEQSEIMKIREKYLPKEVTKLDQLRILDESVTRRGTAISLVHGILFSLVLGVGMCCCMVWSSQWFLPGIIIGCVGILGLSTSFPIYKKLVAQDRERIAPEILRLSNELILETGI